MTHMNYNTVDQNGLTCLAVQSAVYEISPSLLKRSTHYPTPKHLILMNQHDYVCHLAECYRQVHRGSFKTVSYTHLTLPTNREV